VRLQFVLLIKSNCCGLAVVAAKENRPKAKELSKLAKVKVVEIKR
jgi:hypothetical protein